MTRGRFFAAAMPIWAILYAMGIVAFHNGTFAAVRGLVFALIAVVGATVIRPEPGVGRDHRDHRDHSDHRARTARRAARRGGSA